MPLQNYLQSLELNKLEELASFIVSENYSHHAAGELPTNYETEVDEIYQEELHYFRDSSIFVARDYLGNINGSIRVLKWDYEKELPIKKIFGICPSKFSNKKHTLPIWHIGRFAIKKGNKSLNLFKSLLVLIIPQIWKDKRSIAIAEIDSKLLRILTLLGLQVQTLSKPISYLGSDTVPILMNYQGVLEFYNRYRHFLDSETFLPQKTTQKCSSTELAANYTNV